MNNIKTYINFLNELNSENTHLKKIIPNRFIYHQSNPIFRNKIKTKGLIPKGKSESWLSNTNIKGKVIFASNSENKNEWFTSMYDDDIYKIDTKNLNIDWFLDPNFSDIKYIITFNSIPNKFLNLIYKGTGESLE